MEFDLTLEQRQFDDSLRAFLKDRLPMERLRAMAEGSDGFDRELWDGAVELGLPGLLVPERFGGSGLGVLDAAVAAEGDYLPLTPANAAAQRATLEHPPIARIDRKNGNVAWRTDNASDRVVGVNSVGESAPSGVASLVQAPAAATGLAAVASATVVATSSTGAASEAPGNAAEMRAISGS